MDTIWNYAEFFFLSLSMNFLKPDGALSEPPKGSLIYRGAQIRSWGMQAISCHRLTRRRPCDRGSFPKFPKGSNLECGNRGSLIRERSRLAKHVQARSFVGPPRTPVAFNRRVRKEAGKITSDRPPSRSIDLSMHNCFISCRGGRSS